MLVRATNFRRLFCESFFRFLAKNRLVEFGSCLRRRPAHLSEARWECVRLFVE